MLTLMIVGGLFTRGNAPIGGIVTATIGGIFFIAGWLPGTTTALMVIIALLIGALAYAARQDRGVAG